MKNVKFFINTLSNGGAERVVSNLSLNLNNKINKEIILFGKNAKAVYPYDGKLKFLDQIEHKNLFYKIYALLTRAKKLKKIKKNNTNSTIISFLEYPNLINLLTTKYGKTIVSVRNHMSTKHNKGLKSYFWNSTIKYLYERADKIIAVSKEIKRDLTDNYGLNKNKIKVIYNFYSIQKIKKLANVKLETKYKKIFKNPVIITMGRL
ncbi:MAG: glycosyltransferase, partial [archaeon]